MQPSGVLSYTDISQATYDQFRHLAKAQGFNITGNKDNAEWDRIGVRVEYDPGKEKLEFLVHEPIWITPGLMAGKLHDLVAQAERSTADNKAQLAEQNRVDAERKQAKAAEGNEKGHTHAVDTSQKNNGPDHNRTAAKK